MKIIFNDSPKWLLVYSSKPISEVLETMLKSKYGVACITVVLRDYSNRSDKNV